TRRLRFRPRFSSLNCRLVGQPVAIASTIPRPGSSSSDAMGSPADNGGGARATRWRSVVPARRSSSSLPMRPLGSTYTTRTSGLLHVKPSEEKILDMEGNGARLDELVDRNGRGASCGDRIARPAQFLEMAFVGFVALPQHGVVARFDQPLEVVHDICLAVAEDLD